MALDILQSSSFDPCTTASVRLTASVFMMRFALGAGLVLLQPCATAAGNNALKSYGIFDGRTYPSKDLERASSSPILRSPPVLSGGRLAIPMSQDGHYWTGGHISLRGAKPKDFKVLAQYAVEGLPGCGPGTAKKLLGHFGSVERVFAATTDQLCEVKGVGRKTAEQIRELLSYQAAGHPNAQ